MELAVKISKLKKTFSSRAGKVEALRGVDLEVPKGEIFGFLGPNGAGKTTTLRILTTVLPYDEGEAVVVGYNVLTHPHEVRKRIGYVSQKGGADRHATGLDNLLLQGKLHGMDHEKAMKQAKSLVEVFALEEYIERKVESFSGGQQRRLDIAMGMMHYPKILFLDEPTNGLDPQNRANLWDQIRTLKNEGVTIFLTSHYLDEVDALSDTLAIMDHGKIVASGSPTLLKKEISGDVVTIGIDKKSHEKATLLFKEQDSFVREVSWENESLRLYVSEGDAALPQILRVLDKAEITLETIKMSLPSLDDVFLKKTGRLLREEKE